MFLHGARVKREERKGRREGDGGEDQRHAEVRRARRAALFGKERKRAKPLEGPKDESALNDPRCPCASHEQQRDGGQGRGDERELSRAQEVRAQDEKRESRGEEAQGRAA